VRFRLTDMVSARRVAKRKRIKFAVYSVVLLSGVSYGGWRISKLEPAPHVEFATCGPTR